MDYQGSVYYYDGYRNFMKGKSQWWGKNLEEGSGARRDWYEGYNHAMADHDSRMKREMQHSLTQVDTENQQFESLASNPVAAWKGEGLPPVGCECEAKMPRNDSPLWGWRRVKVVISGMVKAENECLVYDVETTRPAWADEFRPILTESDRKREYVANALNKELGDIEKYPTWKDALISVYGLVAAGKIPHIKVEDADE